MCCLLEIICHLAFMYIILQTKLLFFEKLCTVNRQFSTTLCGTMLARRALSAGFVARHDLAGFRRHWNTDFAGVPYLRSGIIHSTPCTTLREIVSRAILMKNAMKISHVIIMVSTIRKGYKSRVFPWNIQRVYASILSFSQFVTSST